MSNTTVSIIIPVINEQQNLANLLPQLHSVTLNGKVEIIVVDGGSTDDTVKISQQFANYVITAKLGRARQLNAGTEIANGEFLWFLHADSHLDSNKLAQYIELIISHNWGRFNVKIAADGWVFNIISKLINLRSRVSKIATGDQGIFINRQLFRQVGGFPVQNLMEDIEICCRLKKITPPFCANLIIKTSARKWQSDGIISTILLMWKLRLFYYLGVNADKLAKTYYS